MKLHILRHADSENFLEKGFDDFDRNLIPEGEERAVKMGIYLNEILSRKLAVYCSSSNRTRQTAALVQSKFEFRNIQFKKELYHASSTQLMNFINELEDDGPVLIVGHNEGLSDLVSYLTGDNIHLNPCQYVCIEFHTTNWKEVSGHSGRLVANYRPELA